MGSFKFEFQMIHWAHIFTSGGLNLSHVLIQSNNMSTALGFLMDNFEQVQINNDLLIITWCGTMVPRSLWVF
jgi:hypothetical protein